MNYPLKNHRDFEKKTLVFFAEGPETAEKVKAVTPEKEKTPANPKEWGEHFKNNYESDKWRASVEKSFENELKPPNGTPRDILDRLINDSVARYESKYAELFARIYKVGTDPEKVIEEIKEKQTEEHKRLDEAIKNLRDVEATAPRLKTLEENDVQKEFNNFLEALKNQYFNLEWQKGHLTEEQLDRYEALSGIRWGTTGFQDHMEIYLVSQLDSIFGSKEAANAGWLKAKLENLKTHLEDCYKKLAGEDGLIDLPGMEDMEEDGKKYMKIMDLINKAETDEEIYSKLEFKEILNPDNWKTATKLLTQQFIKDVTKNGTEAAFIAKVSEMTGKKITDFSDAAGELEDFIEKKAEAGVKETIKAVKDLNQTVNGERAEILALNHVDPPIRDMVRKERDLLLDWKFEPENDDDHIIIEFMSTDREGRSNMLKNPDKSRALFLAIRNVKKYYKAKYSKEYERSLPKKASELSSKNKNHLRAARLLTVITLSEEAEWVIKQMDQTKEFKDKNLTTDLEDTPPDEIPPKIDMKFRDVNKLYSTRYVSRLSRGGFNGRDLALNTGKILAGFTLFANLMQARKQKKLSAFFTNPMIYASAATIWGIGKIQENQEAISYLFKDEGGKERIATHFSLNSLARKVRRRPLKRFMGNADEWNAMEKVMDKYGRRINEKLEPLRQKARKRALKDKNKPVFTKNDLRDVIGDDSVWSQLPDTGNDRMRYLFYEKFLTSPRNIRELQKNCKKWN